MKIYVVSFTRYIMCLYNTTVVVDVIVIVIVIVIVVVVVGVCFVVITISIAAALATGWCGSAFRSELRFTK